jgi:hypothetical protein
MTKVNQNESERSNSYYQEIEKRILSVTVDKICSQAQKAQKTIAGCMYCILIIGMTPLRAVGIL